MSRFVIEDHNAAHYLDVVYRDTRLENRAGWVVIRVCPCHYGMRVTSHYRTEEEATKAAMLLVETSIAMERAGRV